MQQRSFDIPGFDVEPMFTGGPDVHIGWGYESIDSWLAA